jgi:hypothetical protein
MLPGTQNNTADFICLVVLGHALQGYRNKLMVRCEGIQSMQSTDGVSTLVANPGQKEGLY